VLANVDLATKGRNFGYKMRGFLDTRGDPDGMVYYNNALRNCSVQMLQISQSVLAAVEDNVCPRITNLMIDRCGV